ncbi:MAG: PAS domain S-box protein, partial [Deltaproteobacteria bacterium]|nr:PAS domain S-box protein [Deltaproteobacteria bacterium]
SRRPENSEETNHRLRDEVAELKTRLDTYQKSLNEIYGLYDTKIEELSLIRRVSDALRRTLDLRELCLELVDIVAHEVPLERLDLMLMDTAGQALSVKASFEAGTDTSRYFDDGKAESIPLGEGLLAKVIESGTPVIPEPQADNNPNPVSKPYLPLVARDKTVGIMSLNRPFAEPFTESDVRVLTIISDQVASSLASLSLLDELARTNVRLRTSEGQARETSLYLESLLETANDAIFTLDKDGRIMYANLKVEEWGYEREELVGSYLSELVAEPASAQHFKDQLLTSGTHVREWAFRSPSQGRREVLLSVSLLEAGPGRDVNYLVLARDMTERKLLEKQLFHSEKLASIGILAAGVAHEIGNPLSAISGYTQILQGGLEPGSENAEYLEGIASQAERIQRIIEDLLDYSRPSSGMRSEVFVAEAIRSAMSMLQAQKAFKGLQVELDLPDDIPPVFMDRDHLTQVIVNIALNAAQAMPRGGGFKASAAFRRGWIVIELQDSGSGIPDDLKDRVFDPFFTTKAAGEGTGLGLAISQKIVESYNGDIDFDSGPDTGTKFIIRLPASK